MFGSHTVTVIPEHLVVPAVPRRCGQVLWRWLINRLWLMASNRSALSIQPFTQSARAPTTPPVFTISQPAIILAAAVPPNFPLSPVTISVLAGVRQMGQI